MDLLVFKILNKLKLSTYINTFISEKRNGKKVIIPIQGGLGYNNTWNHEPWMMNLFIKISPFFNGNFYDVGVNTGQTLIAAKSVFHNLNYYGFEPNSICVAYIDKLIKLNKWENITIFPVGIGEKAEIKKLDFFNEDDIDPSASMVENFRPLQSIHHSLFVPCFSFQDIFKFTEIKQDSIIKIDVEGGELEVIKGLKELLSLKRPYIIIEILPIYDKENISRLNRQNELEVILNDNGYCILQINTKLLTLNLKNTIGIHNSMDQVDYILAPIEKKDILLQAFN